MGINYNSQLNTITLSFFPAISEFLRLLVSYCGGGFAISNSGSPSSSSPVCSCPISTGNSAPASPDAPHRFIARLHVKQREVGVHELLPRFISPLVPSTIALDIAFAIVACPAKLPRQMISDPPSRMAFSFSIAVVLGRAKSTFASSYCSMRDISVPTLSHLCIEASGAFEASFACDVLRDVR